MTAIPTLELSLIMRLLDHQRSTEFRVRFEESFDYRIEALSCVCDQKAGRKIAPAHSQILMRGFDSIPYHSFWLHYFRAVYLSDRGGETSYAV